MTPRPKLPKRMFAAAMLGVLILAAAVGAAIWATNQAARIAALEKTNDDQAEDVVDLSDSLDESRGQLEEHGIEPETPPPEEVVGEEADPAEQGERGEPGERGPGPTDEQVQRVLDRYCEIHGCSEPPTPLDVARAVAAYCDSRGECQGPPGAEGDPGEDGVDGEPGRDADPVTSEQIAVVVDRYCATHDGCRGPAGADGQAGADGATGPQGEPGPTCPADAPPFEWIVDEARSALTGIPTGTYLMCRAA